MSITTSPPTVTAPEDSIALFPVLLIFASVPIFVVPTLYSPRPLVMFDAVNVPVIASGGAGSAEDFVKLFKEIPDIDAGLAASIFHYGEVAIPDLKNTLNKNNITVRL